MKKLESRSSNFATRILQSLKFTILLIPYHPFQGRVQYTPSEHATTEKLQKPGITCSALSRPLINCALLPYYTSCIHQVNCCRRFDDCIFIKRIWIVGLVPFRLDN